MNELLRVLWIVAKGILLLVGVAAILAGGICGAILTPGALGHDSMAREFLMIAGIVFVVGLAIAIPAWKSLRRDHREARARLDAELEAIRRRGDGSGPGDGGGQ